MKAEGKDTEDLVEQLDLFHRALTRSIRSRTSKIRTRAAAIGITPQQQLALQELVRENGQSLKTPSGRMGLSHSTVSGIVDRLELKKFVYRETDAGDRRINRIYLSEPVKKCVEITRAQIYTPMVKTIMSASLEEKRTIMRV